MLKVVSTLGFTPGALNYQGTWNAATNTPTLTSSVGTKGHYYVVSVAGTTNLNGNNFWGVGDWAVFNGSVWERVEGGDDADVERIIFQTDAGVEVLEGEMAWDADLGTVAIGLSGGNVIQDIGEDVYFYVKNQTGAPLLKGYAIMAVGTLGASGRILAAYANGSTTSGRFFIGIAAETIANGDDGWVQWFGGIRKLNTSGTPFGETWADGDVLWVNWAVPGYLTKTEPIAPYPKISAAIVLRANAVNGSIFVRPQGGEAIGDLSNVQLTSVQNNDVLKYSTTANAFVNSDTVTLSSVTSANVTITSNLFANLATSNTAAMPDPSLPLNPEGYVTIVINGAAKKVPYYGV